ncbi:hypothetical protein LEMLEM_LOCUS24798 [Lemmus lemmus]
MQPTRNSNPARESLSSFSDPCLLTSLKKQMPSVSGMTDDRMPFQPHHSLKVDSPTPSSPLPVLLRALRK